MSEAATERLARLRAEADAARGRVIEARRRMRDEATERAVEAAAPLVKHRDDILHRRPDRTPERERRERERGLTRELFERLDRDGLLVRALHGGSTLQIVDPAVEDGLDAANEDLKEARTRLGEFEAEHAEQLEAERRRAEMEHVREVLAGDDPDAAAEALEALPTPDRRHATLTTADVRG